jgi:rSAM/selenodomain-associated transferase 2
VHPLPYPLVTVIIPALNEVVTLPALFADLQWQQAVSLEVIVGDGGSSDATCAVTEAFGARFVSARRGRGVQMNTAAELASGQYLLFLHADSLIDDPFLLSNGLRALQDAAREHPRVAGHFPLRFIRSTENNPLAYRYLEEKTACNRAGTINGDQGMLLSREFFQELGGFAEGLPFLEDQDLAEKIRIQGAWMTLPGTLATSARRFESEGFHRRYLLMGLMMGLYSIGEHTFFLRAPEVYRAQQDTGQLLLSPFFSLLWGLLRREWGLWGSLRIFYRLGRYLRQNSWQLFFFLDVWLRPLLGAGRYPCLKVHDRLIAPCLDVGIVHAFLGLGCFVWYLVLLPPFFWLKEWRDRNLRQHRHASTE